MISILCPSRERSDLLARSVASLRYTASNAIEVLIAADDDDPATAQAVKDLGPDVRLRVRERAGYDRLHVYYQELAALASGDWLLVWNDDAVMATMGWDVIIEALPNEILIADLPSSHYPLCCFPAIRKEAVKAIGQFSTDNPHVDTFWGDIGLASGTLAQVPVFVSCDLVSRGNPHDFYSPKHQAEMARCVKLLLCYGKS